MSGVELKEGEWMTYIDIELVIDDFLNDADIENAKDLEISIDQIHHHIEIAAYDFAIDNDIDDYEPCYWK